MLKIGVTGSFGAGKLTVARMLRDGFVSRGVRAVVIEADVLAHDILRRDAACIGAVAKAFGKGVVSSKGVDRAQLGDIVFKDPQALKKLERIVHPRLRRMMAAQVKEARGVVILDAAILIEAGWHDLVDVVIVVKARRDVQLRRAMARTGLSRTDVLQRIRRQMTLGAKREYAAHVIDNSGSIAATRKHVEGVIRSLQSTPIQQERAS